MQKPFFRVETTVIFCTAAKRSKLVWGSAGAATSVSGCSFPRMRSTAGMVMAMSTAALVLPLSVAAASLAAAKVDAQNHVVAHAKMSQDDLPLLPLPGAVGLLRTKVDAAFT